MLWLHSGAMRFRNMNQYHNVRVRKKTCLSRQQGWLTDSSRWVPAVPQIVRFTPCLWIYTQIPRFHSTTPLMLITDCYACWAKHRQENICCLPPWWYFWRRLPLCQSELNASLRVWVSTGIFICVCWPWRASHKCKEWNQSTECDSLSFALFIQRFWAKSTR